MNLQAEVRTSVGTGSAKRARRAGLVPTTLFGQELDAPVSLTVNARDLEMLLRREGVNAVFDLEYDGKTQRVYVNNFDKAALRDEFLSLELQAISADQKLEVEVPVFLINEEAIKDGIASLVSNTLLVEARADNIPASIDIDVGEMEIGDVLNVEDVHVDDGVEILAEADTPVVTIMVVSDEEMESDVDADADLAEPEVIGETDEEE